MRLVVIVALGALTACAGEPRLPPGAPQVERGQPVEGGPVEAGQPEVGATSSPTTTAKPAERAPSVGTKAPARPRGDCPLPIEDTGVAAEDTRSGAALVFTTGEALDGDSVETLRRGVRALSTRYERGDMAGVAVRPHVDIITGGMRLVLEPTTPSGLAAVRAHVRQRADVLVESCPTMEIRVVRGDQDEDGDGGDEQELSAREETSDDSDEADEDDASTKSADEPAEEDDDRVEKKDAAQGGEGRERDDDEPAEPGDDEPEDDEAGGDEPGDDAPGKDDEPGDDEPGEDDEPGDDDDDEEQPGDDDDDEEQPGDPDGDPDAPFR